jgi:hypothetical protein
MQVHIPHSNLIVLYTSFILLIPIVFTAAVNVTCSPKACDAPNQLIMDSGHSAKYSITSPYLIISGVAGFAGFVGVIIILVFAYKIIGESCRRINPQEIAVTSEIPAVTSEIPAVTSEILTEYVNEEMEHRDYVNVQTRFMNLPKRENILVDKIESVHTCREKGPVFSNSKEEDDINEYIEMKSPHSITFAGQKMHHLNSFKKEPVYVNMSNYPVYMNIANESVYIDMSRTKPKFK